MALYHLTGVTGTGKSTVLARLKELGYETYDVDEAGPASAKWHHNTTGFVHPKSSIKKVARSPEFLANHSWKVHRHEVTELAKHAQYKAIFLAGTFANEFEIKELFNAVFALIIDDETLQQRITNRNTNDWGKSPHELKHTLAENRKSAERYEQAGAIMIDATAPIDYVVAEILEVISP